MSEQENLPDAADASPPSIYDEEGYVSQESLDELESYLSSENTEELKNFLEPLHESELGDLLEALESDKRSELTRLAGEDFDYAALTEIEEAIRLEIVNSLPNEQIAQAF